MAVRVRCPHCGSAERPYRVRRIRPAGWVLFALYLVFFPALCWAPLLIRESYRRCYDCDRRID